MSTNTDDVPFDVAPTAPDSDPLKFSEIVFDRSALDAARGFSEPEVIAFKGDDGTELVSVGLCGKHGAGRKMVLNAGTWTRIAARYGTRWTVLPPSDGGYVMTTRGDARRAAGVEKASAIVRLSRVVARATGTQVVMFIDGDPLNFRDDNLAVVSRRDFTVLRAFPLDIRGRLLAEARALQRGA